MSHDPPLKQPSNEAIEIAARLLAARAMREAKQPTTPAPAEAAREQLPVQPGKTTDLNTLMPRPYDS